MPLFKKSLDQSIQPKKNTYLALCLCLFLFGLSFGFYLAFPDTVLRQTLIRQFEKHLPVRLELAEANLRPLLTVTGKQANVTLPSQTAPIAQIDSFSLSPKWFNTITGDPGLKGELNSSSGQINFQWQKSGPLGIQGSDMPFEVPLATRPAMRIAGELKTVVIETEAPIQKQTESLLEISLGRVTIRGLEAISGNPNGLQLGNLILQATGQGNSFTVKNIQASDGDLLIAGQGTLILSTADPTRSRINLNLTVTAGKSAEPTLSSLLELAGKKQSDGSRKLRLTGTLANPILR